MKVLFGAAQHDAMISCASLLHHNKKPRHLIKWSDKTRKTQTGGNARKHKLHVHTERR